MNFDSFLTYPRWEILQIIAEKPSSPVEIAEQLKATVSYASQQLKLLDAAGLLVKSKTGAAEKGKPRTLFALSSEFLYLSILAHGLTEKKLIYLTNYHKNILKIWLLRDSSYHYYIEKLFWRLEGSLNELEGIFLETKTIPRVIVVSDSKKLKSDIDTFIKSFDKSVDYSFISLGQIKKLPVEGLISLHDPKNIIEQLKGGFNKDNKNE
jgi:hypothetical protein